MGVTNLDTLSLADGLRLDVTTGIVAAGSNSQANSTALTKPVNIVATVSATTRGVRLPTATAGDIVIVKNKSMHTATNYYLFSLAISDLMILVLGNVLEI